jgi:fluoroquinolone transport system permease protein
MTQHTLTAQTALPRRLNLTRALRTLTLNDARLIGRDSFLSGMIGFMLIFAILLRFGIPWLTDVIAQNPDVQLDLTTYYPLLLAYMAIFQGAMIGGLMIGFIVLDERDDNTIKALLVTPLPVTYYLAYRVLIPSLLGFGVILMDFMVINLALVPLWQLILIAAVGGLFGPIAMLMLATLAENKVQGFVQVKIIGTSGLLIFAAWFLQPPFEYLVGLFPPYWAAKAYWMAYAGDPNWWLPLIVGALYSGVVIGLIMRRFRKVAYN